MSLDGVVAVDKPAGCTSHDVVAQVRRRLDTRKVGHAGTLDPLATGLLVVGVGRATRLLGYLAAGDKAYDATIVLGRSTTTDDAAGETLHVADAREVTEQSLAAAVEQITGPLQQVPSAVSAVKQQGRRAHERIRSGETVDLPARSIVVHRFDVVGMRTLSSEPASVELDVEVVVSAGTYVRALARDLGQSLGVGGHVGSLRRTRSGSYGLADTVHLDLVAEQALTPLAEVLRRNFPVREVGDTDAEHVRHGRPIEVQDERGPTAVFDRDGSPLALVAPRGADPHSLRVLVGLAG